MQYFNTRRLVLLSWVYRWRILVTDKISNLFHVLTSQGCQSKVPQTKWHKTTEICSLMALEAKSKTKVLAELVPSKALRENLFHYFLPVSGDSYQPLAFLACRYFIPVSTSIFTWPSSPWLLVFTWPSSYKDTSRGWPFLSMTSSWLVECAMILFPNKVIFCTIGF